MPRLPLQLLQLASWGDNTLINTREVISSMLTVSFESCDVLVAHALTLWSPPTT